MLFQDRDAAMRMSLMYFNNSCDLVLYFSRIILVNMMNAEVHFSMDKNELDFCFTKHMVPLRIWIWPCVSTWSTNSLADFNSRDKSINWPSQILILIFWGTCELIGSKVLVVTHGWYSWMSKFGPSKLIDCLWSIWGIMISDSPLSGTGSGLIPGCPAKSSVRQWWSISVVLVPIPATLLMALAGVVWWAWWRCVRRFRPRPLDGETKFCSRSFLLLVTTWVRMGGILTIIY